MVFQLHVSDDYGERTENAIILSLAVVDFQASEYKITKKIWRQSLSWSDFGKTIGGNSNTCVLTLVQTNKSFYKSQNILRQSKYFGPEQKMKLYLALLQAVLC